MVRRPRSPDALMLCGLLFLLGWISFRIAGQSALPEEGGRPRRSVSSAQPGGWKALYLLLPRCGIRAEKVERGPGDWPDTPRVLVTGDASPDARWTGEEAGAALRWVAKAHTLIILTGESNELVQRLGLTVQSEGASNRTLFPIQPVPFLSGVSGLSIPGAGRFRRRPKAAVPLFADRQPAVLLLRYGDGSVVALSDSALADNQHLAEADNAGFLAAVLHTYAREDGRVGFDEFHQGFQAADSLWDAIGRPAQLAAWQLFGLVVLASYSAGRRFGLPRPLPAPSRVSSEYVASLADLYRRAGAADAALEGVYLAFRRDLCRAGALPFDAPIDEAVRRAVGTIRAARGEERLRRVVNECAAKIQAGRVPESDLVPLARDLEALRKELGLGGDDRDFRAGR